MRMRAVAAVLAVVGLVAGCGGGDDVDPEKDKASAEAAVEAAEERLREDGFESAAEDDDDDDDIAFDSEECEQFAAALPDADEPLPGETASERAEFERGELDADGGTEESVTVSVKLVEDDKALDERFELFGDERLPGCLEEGLQNEFDSQSEDAGIEVSDLKVERGDLDDIGDEAILIEVDATLAAGGFEFPFHIDLAVVRSGRIGALASVSAVGDDEASVDTAALLELMLEEAGAD
jgi:hypothetical protein